MILTGKIINKLIDDNAGAKGLMKHYDSLYRGKHAILNKTVSSDLKPNNKLVNSFFKQVVDYPASYFLGKPVVVNHNTSTDIQEALNYVFIENDKDDLFYEVCKESDIKGVSYMLVYQNETGDTKLVRVPGEELICIQNPSTKEMEYAIRYYLIEDKIEDKTYNYVEVYSKTDVSYWIEDEGELILDTSVANNVPHIFGRVPVVKVVPNEEEQSIVSVIESLVNDYDKIMSDSSDQHESYKNAYMVLKNAILSDEGIVKLQEQGILELPEGADVSFLTKDLKVDAVEKHLDRLEKNIHKFANTPDLADEKFASNLSGVAIAYKLYGLEVRVGNKERKFTKALRELLKLIAIPIKIQTGQELRLTDVDIQYVRNIPTNIVEAVTNAVALNGTGLVDKETILSLLPFVSDPMAILEKVKKEQEEESGSNYPNLETTTPVQA